MKLHELRDNPGATRKAKRVGRGPGSGKGKTAGRGIKGQKARAGIAIKGYEGGQMPLHRRLPKRGFTNPFRPDYVVVNLGQLQGFIDSGRIDPTKPIDEAALVASGLVRRVRDGVRLLAKGELTSAGLAIAVTGASRAAVEAVAAKGGTLSLTLPAAPEADAAAAGGGDAAEA